MRQFFLWSGSKSRAKALQIINCRQNAANARPMRAFCFFSAIFSILFFFAALISEKSGYVILHFANLGFINLICFIGKA
jgi:hypothetical protein